MASSTSLYDAFDARDLTRLWEDRLAAEEITLSQASLLDCLRGGDHTIKELTKAESVTSPSITGIVMRLEAKGWVTRRPGKDRRTVVVALTGAGDQMIQHIGRIVLPVEDV